MFTAVLCYNLLYSPGIMFTVVLCVAGLIIGLVIYRRRYHNLSHIPGPGLWASIVDVMRVSDHLTYHLTLTDLAKQHGPVMHVSRLDSELIVVSSYEAIREMYMIKGRELSGRPAGPTARFIGRHFGVLGAYEADELWNTQRKLIHRHLKQFGEGITRTTGFVRLVAEDMFQSWKEANDKPIDPEADIYQMLQETILYIIMGTRTRQGDPLLDKVQRFFHLAVQCFTFNPTLKYLILDLFPWTRYFGPRSWKTICDYNALELEIWEEMKSRSFSNTDNVSLVKTLLSSDQKLKAAAVGCVTKVEIKEINAQKTVMDTILAGMITTLATFHAMINLLAHNHQIQGNIHKEIHNVTTLSRPVTLDDRPRMPYTRAVILEVLRYLSTVPGGVVHRCSQDTTVLGHPIYRHTLLRANLWALHHDPEFWGDPNVFRPERFLDEGGELVPPGDPIRQHVMAFGSGTRVCIGESLALARLFVLLSDLVMHFKVSPAEGNTKDLTDCLTYRNYAGTIRSGKYKVIFQQRLMK